MTISWKLVRGFRCSWYGFMCWWISYQTDIGTSVLWRPKAFLLNYYCYCYYIELTQMECITGTVYKLTACTPTLVLLIVHIVWVLNKFTIIDERPGTAPFSVPQLILWELARKQLNAGRRQARRCIHQRQMCPDNFLSRQLHKQKAQGGGSIPTIITNASLELLVLGGLGMGVDTAACWYWGYYTYLNW